MSLKNLFLILLATFVTFSSFSVLAKPDSEQVEELKEQVKKQSDPTGTRSGSSSARLQGLLSAGTSGLTGALLMKKCPKSGVACAMGAMALGQVAQSLANSGSAGNTAFDATNIPGFDFGGGSIPTSDFPSFDESGNPTGPLDLKSPKAQQLLRESGLTAGQVRDIVAAQSTLDESGFSFDPTSGSVTGPGFSASAASLNAGGLEASGLSAEEIQGLNAATKKIRSKFNVAAVKAGGGGGGGRRFGRGNQDGSSVPDLNFGFQNVNAKRADFKGKVEGLTRNLAGERIGVAGDNIFKMMSRRYQVKAKAKHFLP